MAFISDRRLYLTRDKERVVEDGDSAAGYLLVAPGCEVDSKAVVKYGLKLINGRVQVPQNREKQPQPEAKMVDPPENKARTWSFGGSAEKATETADPEPVPQPEAGAPPDPSKRGRPRKRTGA